MTRKLGLELKTHFHVSRADSCQCFITVVPLCAWDFVFAGQTGGQSCRLVVIESIFDRVYNACAGVCAPQVR